MNNPSDELLNMTSQVIDHALEQVIDVYKNKGLFIPISISDQGVLHRYIDQDWETFSVTQKVIDKWIEALFLNLSKDSMHIFIHDGRLTSPDDGIKRDALIIDAFDYVNGKVFTFWLMYEIEKKLLMKPTINEIGNMKTLSVKDL